MNRKELAAAKRIVVKIGTSSITLSSGKLDIVRIDKLARVLSGIKAQDREVVLVTSGAISAGADRLGLGERPSTVSGRQAAASVGQSSLMEFYNKSFAQCGCVAGQVLLTKDVLDKPISRQNAENTFAELFKWGVIPVINENDTISTDEICFGDNDNLSACVAVLVNADLLVLLTDTDGVFDSDPNGNKNAKLINRVDCPETLRVDLSGRSSRHGTGGMQSKVNAAAFAAKHGINAVVANAGNERVLSEILVGKEVGTWFVKHRTVDYEQQAQKTD